MIVKIIIVLLIILMIAALTMALKQLISSEGNSKKFINALTWRIGIWIVLIVFIILAVQLKWLNPSESLIPKQQGESQSQ